MKKAFICMVLVVGVFLGLTFDNAYFALAAQSGTSVSGIIIQDTTWTKANSPFQLTGPTSVNVGVTLTIEPGVTVRLNQHYIQVNGTLNAIGTNSDQINIENGAIQFTSIASSSSIIHETNFSNKASVTVASPVTITNTTGIYLNIQDASPKISNNNECVVEVWGGSPVISDNENLQVTVLYGSPIISFNTIRAQIVLRNGNSQIKGNTIPDQTYFSAYGSPTIEGNLIATTLIISSETTSTVQNNTFAGSSSGISTGKGTLILNLKFNNFQNISGRSIYWGASNNLDASYNWWGTTDIQAINQSIYDFKNDFTLGSVNFLPVLTSPNPEAPVIPTPTPSSSSNGPSPSVLPTPTIPEFPTMTPIIIALMLAALTFNIQKKRKKDSSTNAS